MKKPYFTYSLLGGILGLFPASLLVLSDRSFGHGGDTIALLTLVVLGIPGMAIGSTVGAIIQHGITRARIIAMALGTILGAVTGLFSGLILHESLRSSVPVREKDTACFVLLGGGLVGILLGGLIGRRDGKP